MSWLFISLDSVVLNIIYVDTVSLFFMFEELPVS